MTITAISIHQPYADQIAAGTKATEYRNWATKHRGPLLICATKAPCLGHATGVAVCIVDLVDCVTVADGDVHWLLRNPRPVPNFPVKGKQKLYKVSIGID